MKRIGIFSLLIVAVLALGFLQSTEAFNFSINGTTINVDPADGECSIYAFSTTYHYNHDVTGRNADYPSFEYQYEGEQVDFWATIQDFSQYQLMNADVDVRAVCDSGNSYRIQLERTSEPSFQNGVYQAQWHGMWLIPDAVVESSNCELRVLVQDPVTGNNYCRDLLENGMYTNVNDVLVNPQISFYASNAFNFVPTIYNAYNPSSPLWVDYSLMSNSADREGEAVIGDLFVSVPRLRGMNSQGLIWTNNTGDVIPASQIRFHKNYDMPGVYTNLVDDESNLFGKALVMDDVAIHGVVPMSQSIRLFWELYYSQLYNAPNGYVSDPSWNGGNILFEYIIV